MKNTATSLKRRERKKKATRDAIFRVAQKLFDQKGFENTSVEDITEKVDIAQSTFFNYFPRKEDILVEIFKRKLPFLRKKCQDT
jgi:AcrR family transcriptional regulator